MTVERIVHLNIYLYIVWFLIFPVAIVAPYVFPLFWLLSRSDWFHPCLLYPDWLCCFQIPTCVGPALFAWFHNCACLLPVRFAWFLTSWLSPWLKSLFCGFGFFPLLFYSWVHIIYLIINWNIWGTDLNQVRYIGMTMEVIWGNGH